MKKFVFSLLLNILILYFVFNTFKSVTIPTDLLYLISVYVGLSLGIMLHRPLLKFLTVKINILTYLLSASIIALGVMYGLVTFLPGFEVGETIIKGFNIGALSISTFKLDSMMTMVSVAVVASLISSIMETLKKPAED